MLFMKKETRLRSFTKVVMTMALLTSPTIGAMAQHSILLPAKIQTKETEASVTLPYTNKLNSLAEFNKMTVVDANNDGTTWQFSDYFNMAAYASIPRMPLTTGLSLLLSTQRKALYTNSRSMLQTAILLNVLPLPWVMPLLPKA